MWKPWIASVLLLVLMACAPQARKKQYVLQGRVEAVDSAGKTLTVKHQKVDGWMDAMTMAYSVHDPSVLTQIKPGDEIQATVYEDEFSLYNVKITGKNPRP